jgi:AraC-like DNA-binding protein
VLPLLLPGTGAELVLHYRAPFVAVAVGGRRYALAPAHISCLRASSCRLVAQGPVGFVAVRFRSSTIRHLAALEMGDMIERFPAAAEHFGPEIDELPAQLARLPDFAARAGRVVQFLLCRLAGSAPELTAADRAVDALYYADPGESVAELADDFGYGVRQLERLVGGAAGLTPKRFLRLARMHHTVRHLLLAKQADYLDAALARGYYDQAHFIHEMGELTGHTPRQVLTPGSFLSHFYNPRLPR